MPTLSLRSEHFLIGILTIALLFSLWRNYKPKIKKLRQQLKNYLPRKWKPTSPKDCPGCQDGTELAILKPNFDVIPDAQRKSNRGRSRRIAPQGHACPNPKCEYFGVSDHNLHAVVGYGKRGIEKHISVLEIPRVPQTLLQSPAHSPLSLEDC